MKAFSKYEIPFVGLKKGEHRFHYSIDSAFFQEFETSPISDGQFEVELIFEKSNFFDLTFIIDGFITAECDRCTETFEMEFSGTHPLLVKFTENVEYEQELTSESDDDLIYLSRNETHLNVAQYIYEFIVLSMPLQKVHPDDDEGNPGCEIEYSSQTESEGDSKEETTDPRWEALKKLKNN